MAHTSRPGDPLFHLQGGAVLGAVVGLVLGAAAPRTVALAAAGAAALAFIIWFRGSLWPLISKERFYESFFGIPGPGPVTYINEGAAAGVIAGTGLGLVASGTVASLLVWVGLGLLLVRYMSSLRCLLDALRGAAQRGSAYRRLLAEVHGDRALAERLMAYEGRQGPAAGRDELAARALARLERDRR